MRKRKKVLHFKSMAGYKKWLAYGHLRGKFKVPGHQEIYIRGKKRKVKHKRR